MSNVLQINHVMLSILLQPYKLDVHICQPLHSAIAIRRKRSSAASNTPATRKKRIEKLEPFNKYNYWPAHPAFNPERQLLRRLFFINENQTKYVSICFYPARVYLPQGEFGVVRRGEGPKTLIISYEQVDAMAEVLPILGDAMCSGETYIGGRGCESGAFRPDVTRSRPTARLYSTISTFP
jgi:hypothetical protein